MGIYINRIYFKQGLPKIIDIQKKFNEITGLNVVLTCKMYLRKIVDNQENITYYLNRSKDEVDFSYHPEFEGDKSEISKEKPYLSTPYFSCIGFEDVYLGECSVEEKSFALEYGIRCENLYFFHALIKTMYELGGLRFRHNHYPSEKDLNIEDYLEPYYPYNRFWKRIKKWTEMSDFEKVSFKSKYAE